MTKPLAAVFALVILPFSGWASAEDLLEMAQRSGSFKIFLDAVKTSGLTRELKTEGPFTAFIPTDDAFGRLAEGQWQTLSKNPEQMARMVRYHLTRGKMKVTEVKPGRVSSIEGHPLNLKSDNGMVSVNGARVTESDLMSDNAIIHAIDAVLLPPD